MTQPFFFSFVCFFSAQYSCLFSLSLSLLLFSHDAAEKLKPERSEVSVLPLLRCRTLYPAPPSPNLPLFLLVTIGTGVFLAGGAQEDRPSLEATGKCCRNEAGPH